MIPVGEATYLDVQLIVLCGLSKKSQKRVDTEKPSHVIVLPSQHETQQENTPWHATNTQHTRHLQTPQHGQSPCQQLGCALRHVALSAKQV